MAASSAVVEPVWERYPLIASNSYARRWIQSCVMLGLARLPRVKQHESSASIRMRVLALRQR